MFIDSDHATFSSKRFLVVDDYQGMRTMFREILKSCGAREIDAASNGKEAIALLEAGKYDVVLCDFNLGSGKNGQQVMEEAKVRNLIGLSTAWIVISAEKSAEMVLGAMEHIPDDYVIKPFTEAIIRSRILNAIARREMLHDVEKAVFEKDYARAISLCDDKLKSGVGHAGDLIRIKAGMLITAGQRKQAKDLVEKVLAHRDIPWAKVDLAKIHYMEGEFERARDLLVQVTEQNRTYMGAYDLLAKILEEKGDLDEAQNVLVCGVDLSPNSPSRQKTLGEIAQKRGDLDVAERAFRKTIALTEHSILKVPSAYIGLAKVCTLKNNPGEAMRVLGEAQKNFDSTEATIHAKVVEGTLYRQNRDLKAVQQIAKELAGLVKVVASILPAAIALEAAEFIMANGDVASASGLLKSVVLNNHENEAVLAKVREIFRQVDRHEDGEDLIESSLSEVVDCNNTAVHLAKAGKLDEAIAMLRNAKKMMPSNKRILLNLSYALILAMQNNNAREIGMDREVREYLEQVRKFEPGNELCAKYRNALDAIPFSRAAA